MLQFSLTAFLVVTLLERLLTMASNLFAAPLRFRDIQPSPRRRLAYGSQGRDGYFDDEYRRGQWVDRKYSGGGCRQDCFFWQSTIATGNDVRLSPPSSVSDTEHRTQGASGPWFPSSPGTAINAMSVASTDNTILELQPLTVEGVVHDPILYNDVRLHHWHTKLIFEG